jgi:hypothetical protein
MITAIVQPGGSDRDFDVITACNEAMPKATMVFTGILAINIKPSDMPGKRSRTRSRVIHF